MTKKHKEKTLNPTWTWRAGIVDINNEHIKLFHEKKKDPIALVAPDNEKGFMVQFLLFPNPKDKETSEILESVKKELTFYLVDKKEENPWAYVVHHCGTGANFYSKVHWKWHPKDEDDN